MALKRISTCSRFVILLTLRGHTTTHMWDNRAVQNATTSILEWISHNRTKLFEIFRKYTEHRKIAINS